MRYIYIYTYVLAAFQIDHSRIFGLGLLNGWRQPQMDEKEHRTDPEHSACSPCLRISSSDVDPSEVWQLWPWI